IKENELISIPRKGKNSITYLSIEDEDIENFTWILLEITGNRAVSNMIIKIFQDIDARILKYVRTYEKPDNVKDSSIKVIVGYHRFDRFDAQISGLRTYKDIESTFEDHDATKFKSSIKYYFALQKELLKVAKKAIKGDFIGIGGIDKQLKQIEKNLEKPL
ncbi:MAG: hypothetical protein AAF806_00975, partial [Bacteroidota bacterium]